MNKVKTTVGRILFSSLLFFLGCTSFLFAIESEQLALMVSSIKESSTSMLIEKSIFLGLPSRNDREELINNLYSFYGFTPSIEEKIEEDFISINQADYFYIHKDKNIIFLDGNVSITFDSNSLQSNSILYDSSSGYLYAIGAVTLEQQKGEEQEIVIGNTLTYNRDNGQIMMNKGITKTSSSDEDGNITTFTSKGEEILLSNDPLSVLVKGSSVTTSEKSEYYQIKSKYFHVNDGNDLFLTHSFLYMGRVPILYLPFFFYPGKTIMFNPAFGYDSIKGPYINTSYELYGKNPLIHEDENSSITSLLGMNKNLEKSSSFIYSSLPQEPLSKVEKWAKESDSYGTIFVDAYKNNGLFIGYEGVHHLLNKTLDASLLGGVAYKNPTDLTNGSLIRFFITPNVSYKKNKTQLNLSLPFYSDPDVKKEYLDRDIRTELLELASINTKEENTLSTINSFTWAFSGSTSFSPPVLSPFIEEIKVSKLNSSIAFEKNFNSLDGGYIFDSITLLDAGVLIKGTVIEYKSESKETEKPIQVTYSDNQKKSLGLYNLSNPSSSLQISEKVPFSSSLKVNYEIKQEFKELFDYKRGEWIDTVTKNNNISFISLQSVIGPQYITFNQVVRSILANTSTWEKESNQYELWSDTSISLPFLSLNYTFDQRIYRNNYQKENLVEDINRGFTDFSSDYVKTHSLSYNPSFSKKDFLINPSVTLILPPLEPSITPKISISYKKLQTSLSIAIKENDAALLDIDKGTFTFSYKGEIITFSNNANYSRSTIPSPFIENIVNTTNIGISGWNSFVKVGAKSIFNSKTSLFTHLSGSLTLPFLDVTMKGSQQDDKIIGESLDFTLSNSMEKKLWWKERISLSYDVNLLYHHSYIDSFGSFASLELSFTFEIYKFLSLKGTLKSVNRGLYRYATLQDAFKDLIDSFDFFGNGRTTTQFIMDSFSLSLIHYMDDWDLYVTYEAKMENVSNRFEWTPRLQILVKWKAINEIKVDREVKL